MHRKTIFLIISLLLLIGSKSVADTSIKGVVKKIIDGDSLVILAGKKSIEVRLYGIDCPEYGQPFSLKAKNFSKKQVLGKKVLLKPQYYDSYGRLVAMVEDGKQSLNGEMVRAGLAWVYPRYCRKKICTSWKEMEGLAKAKERGLWGTFQPVPPWIWKRRK